MYSPSQINTVFPLCVCIRQGKCVLERERGHARLPQASIFILKCPPPQPHAQMPASIQNLSCIRPSKFGYESGSTGRGLARVFACFSMPRRGIVYRLGLTGGSDYVFKLIIRGREHVFNCKIARMHSHRAETMPQLQDSARMSAYICQHALALTHRALAETMCAHWQRPH